MIPGYRSFELLGRGGSADVYRAWEDSLHRYVAVKVLRASSPADDDRQRTRFEREKALHAQLAGRGLAVVPVFRADVTADGRPFVVMQLYDGSVHDWLTQEGTTFTDAQAVAVLRPVAEAVQGAHDLDVVHGDIKPENILLSEGGPALGDFGVARAVLSGTASPGEAERLTLRHAAPEVLDGDAPTRASDVWSLGSTLYRMLAPECPFELRPGESLAAFRHRVRYDPIPPMMRQLQEGLWELVEAAMAKDPATRPDARDLRRRLDAIARVQLPTTAPTLTAGATVVRPPADVPLPPGAGAPSSPPEAPTEAPTEAPPPAGDEPAADPHPAPDPGPDVAAAPWPDPSPFAARHDAPLPPPPTVRGRRGAPLPTPARAPSPPPLPPASPPVPSPAPPPFPAPAASSPPSQVPTPAASSPVPDPPSPPQVPAPAASSSAPDLPSPSQVPAPPAASPAPTVDPPVPPGPAASAPVPAFTVDPPVQPGPVPGPVAGPGGEPVAVDVGVGGWSPGPPRELDGRHTIDWPDAGPRPEPAPSAPPRAGFPAWLAIALAAVLAVAGVAAVVARSGGSGTDEDDDTGTGDEEVGITLPDSVPPAGVDPSLVPSDFVADDFGSTVDLHWTDNADGRLDYVIVYRTPGEEQQIVEVPAGVTTHTVRDLDPDAPYCFRLLGVGLDPEGEVVRASADTAVRGCEAEDAPDAPAPGATDTRAP